MSYGWTKKYIPINIKDLESVIADIRDFWEPGDDILYYKVVVRKAKMHKEIRSSLKIENEDSSSWEDL